MFTIEHDFDTTRVTLIDEDGTQDDIVIRVEDHGVTVEQTDPASGAVETVAFSPSQLAELRAALNLPEGAYRLEPTSQG